MRYLCLQNVPDLRDRNHVVSYYGWPDESCVHYHHLNAYYTVDLGPTGNTLLENWSRMSAAEDPTISAVLADYLSENRDDFIQRPTWPEWATEALDNVILFLHNRFNGLGGRSLWEQEQEQERRARTAQEASASLGYR